MNAYCVFKSLRRMQSGTILDVRSRNLKLARLFAKDGFRVHAIDPNPIEYPDADEGIAFEQTTLEAFETDRKFDLVVASYVSHLVSYRTNKFLDRLKGLTAESGLIFVTLLGGQDGWANQDWARAIDLAAARELIANADLNVLFESEHQFKGHLYDGTPKFWHVLKFIVGRHMQNPVRPIPPAT